MRLSNAVRFGAIPHSQQGVSQGEGTGPAETAPAGRAGPGLPRDSRAPLRLPGPRSPPCKGEDSAHLHFRGVRPCDTPTA